MTLAIRTAGASVFAFTLLFSGVAIAADAGIAITGAVQHPQTLSLADLEKQPPVTVHVSLVTGHGPEIGDFTGAALWPILQSIGTVDAPGKNSALRHTITISGSDGYAIALSYGELNPDLGNAGAILAYQKNGQPLDPKDGIRLIVSTDKRGGRAVHNVVTIEVR